MSTDIKRHVINIHVVEFHMDDESEIICCDVWQWTIDDWSFLPSRLCYLCNWVTPASCGLLSNTTMPYVFIIYGRPRTDWHTLCFHWFILFPGGHFIIKTVIEGLWIPIMKIRRSHDRLIFIMGIPILLRQHLYIEAPCCLVKAMVDLWTPLTPRAAFIFRIFVPKRV